MPGNNKLNVHAYDGLLKTQYLELVKWDGRYLPPPPDFELCMEEIEVYIKSVLDKKLLKVGLNLHKMLSTDHRGNYDKTNRIKFEDILPRVWRFYRHIDVPSDKYVFLQQFLDIQRGTCAQGRAGARLYQLYYLWIDDLQWIHRKEVEQLALEQERKGMAREDKIMPEMNDLKDQEETPNKEQELTVVELVLKRLRASKI